MASDKGDVRSTRAIATTILDIKSGGLPAVSHSKVKVPAQPSLIFRLPLKIRQSMYAFALSLGKSIPISTNQTIVVSEGNKLVRSVQPYQPALLQTCIQIEQEATPIYYNTNDFSFTISSKTIEPLLDWLQSTFVSRIHDFGALVLKFNVGGIMDLFEAREALVNGQIKKNADLLVRNLQSAAISPEKVELSEPEVEVAALIKEAEPLGLDVDDADEVAWELFALFEDAVEEAVLQAKSRRRMARLMLST